MNEVMYKTDINVLIDTLTPKQKDKIIKEVILTCRKEGNNYVVGAEVRQLLRKILPHKHE